MRALVAIFEQLVPISGGGTPRTLHIVRTLNRRGHTVSVAASFGVPPVEARSALDCADVLALPFVSRLDPHKMRKYALVYPWDILCLALHIARYGPDLVISHNTVPGFGALLGKALRPRTLTVLDLTDLLFEYLESYGRSRFSLVSWLGRAMERYTIQHSDHIITISQAMRSILVQEYGVSESRVEVVHDGVDCEVFRNLDVHEDGLRQRVSPWARHVCILHGVIDPQDGPELLVEAAPRVLQRFPETAFWWVGDGSAVPALKVHAQELGLDERFFFSGWVSQAEVVQHINASDLGLVVLPDILSARGRVTLKEFEYWACGKAAILPRLPALQEIIPEDKASLFYTPGDAADLAEKICMLLGDDERRQAMGQQGRQMVSEHFEWRVLTDELVALCESFCALQKGKHQDTKAQSHQEDRT
jgi:glycosyltransferase involved in cell wall biosynthesis